MLDIDKRPEADAADLVVGAILGGGGRGYVSIDAVCPACDAHGLEFRPVSGWRQRLEAYCRRCGNAMEF